MLPPMVELSPVLSVLYPRNMCDILDRCVTCVTQMHAEMACTAHPRGHLPTLNTVHLDIVQNTHLTHTHTHTETEMCLGLFMSEIFSLTYVSKAEFPMAIR